MDKKAVEKAVAYFSSDFSCAQSVFAAHAPAFGLSEDAALRISSPFGGGIARCGRTCGAVTGALMVLGLRDGQGADGDAGAKERVYAAAREFLSRFEAIHGSTACIDLIGIDLGQPGGVEKYSADHANYEKCEGLVRSACEILEELVK